MRHKTGCGIIPVCFVYVGDEEAELVHTFYKCHNFTAAEGLDMGGHRRSGLGRKDGGSGNPGGEIRPPVQRGSKSLEKGLPCASKEIRSFDK